MAEKKHIKFHCAPDPDLPEYLYGDDIRLRQILTNICGNAIKFTQKGYVRMSVFTADEQLCFEIKDTGMGIKKEDIGKLFNAFSQADERKNRGIVGTGLGLSISKAFANMMGGGITVTSDYGKGSVFTVAVPLVIGDESGFTLKRKGSKAESLTVTGAHILVVDDNAFNLRVAQGLLRLSGIEAQTVSSGEEAVKMVRKHDYDIVFMDHMMPGMDGVETTKVIRDMGGKHEKQTIIALTANAVHGAKEMFLKNRFDDFLSKPIDMQELNEILKEWLPAEKVEVKSKAEPKAAKEKSVMEALHDIEEIDTEAGLRHVAGEVAIYQDMADSFYQNLAPQIETTGAHFEQGDMEAFSIAIHGMKSMLSTIGAMELASADRKSTRLNSSHSTRSRMPSSA
jgi:CheY-like chemotaxis protein